jgi:hypothetical protein
VKTAERKYRQARIDQEEPPVAEAVISDEQKRIDQLKREIERRETRNQIMLAILPVMTEKGAETLASTLAGLMAVLDAGLNDRSFTSLEEKLQAKAELFAGPAVQELKDAHRRGLAKELWLLVDEVMETRDLTAAQVAERQARLDAASATDA